MWPYTDHPYQEDLNTLISTHCIHLAGPHTGLSFPCARNPTRSKLLLEAHDAQSMSLGTQRVELRLGKEQRSWGSTGRSERPPERMGRRHPSPLASAATSLPLDPLLGRGEKMEVPRGTGLQEEERGRRGRPRTNHGSLACASQMRPEMTGWLINNADYWPPLQTPPQSPIPSSGGLVK